MHNQFRKFLLQEREQKIRDGRECREMELMPLLTDIFQWLPLAHVIGGKVLPSRPPMHAGLLPKLKTPSGTLVPVKIPFR
jgi:hypothetical protein